jgi:hypothetical protein
MTLPALAEQTAVVTGRASLDEAAAMAAFIVSPETSFTFDLTGGRAVY